MVIWENIRNNMNANKVDAVERLKEEHNAWNKSHPKGLIAKPCIDGETENWLKWKCAIPGKPKTSWEGGLYHLVLEFTLEYPYHPPLCRFDPPIFHPNVFSFWKGSIIHTRKRLGSTNNDSTNLTWNSTFA